MRKGKMNLFFYGRVAMNIQRCFAQAICAFASLCLIMGVNIYAQEESAQNMKFVSKSQDSLAKSFLRGPRGHHGHRGEHGHHGRRGSSGHAGAAGAVGPQGPIGPQGPAGASAAVATGSAYGVENNDALITLHEQNPQSLQLAPLKYGTPQSPGNPFFTFTPYINATTGSCYTITQAGTYLLQYGLVAVKQGEEDEPGKYWIAIHVQGSSPRDIGAVPLSTSTWIVTSDEVRLTDVCGFGQISTYLVAGDVISLQVMVVGKDLTIQASNITNPATTPVARGPTLTITKIAD